MLNTQLLVLKLFLCPLGTMYILPTTSQLGRYSLSVEDQTRSPKSGKMLDRYSRLPAIPALKASQPGKLYPHAFDSRAFASIKVESNKGRFLVQISSLYKHISTYEYTNMHVNMHTHIRVPYIHTKRVLIKVNVTNQTGPHKTYAVTLSLNNTP